MASPYFVELQSKANYSKEVQWYNPDLDAKLISSDLRDLLANYSGIPPSEIESHLHSIRDQAWRIFPFPCIGEWWFILLGISHHPYYATLLSRLRHPADPSSPPPKLLDMGTGLGQDLRKLLYDGAPLSSLYGADVFPAYESAGFAFFRDAATFQGRFVLADLFDEEPAAPLNVCAGQWDVVNCSMFLHLFDYAQCLAACKRLLGILSPRKGSVVLGVQVAMAVAQRMKLPPGLMGGEGEGEEKFIFQHSRESFVGMWREAAGEVGVDVRVEAEYGVRKELGETEIQGDERARKLAPGKDRRRLFFVVERV